MDNTNWGGETFVFGEALEKTEILHGLRVKVKGENETGTVYLTLLNREKRLAQIWVKMDSGGARCFRPYHLFVISPTRNQITFLRSIK